MRKVKSEIAEQHSSGSDEAPGPSFEVRLGRLETIVTELENGERSLEDALRLFEEGTELTRLLSATLDAAERKIELLVRDQKGDVKLVPFTPESK